MITEKAYPISDHFRTKKPHLKVIFGINMTRIIRIKLFAKNYSHQNYYCLVFRYTLKSTIYAQLWHDWANLKENIHPFVILR